jgi:hypothetical protein
VVFNRPAPLCCLGIVNDLQLHVALCHKSSEFTHGFAVQKHSCSGVTTVPAPKRIGGESGEMEDA